MSFLGLEEQKVVVFGFANKKSVAYHVGKALLEVGAEVIHVVHSEKNAELGKKLFPESDFYICDVEKEEDIKSVAQEIQEKHPTIQGLVHSIAFGDYSEGWKPFHETPKKAFLQSVDISCYSFIAIANSFKPLLSENASVVVISISTTEMASENYGFMAPVKAALDSSVCFLAKSFSDFSKVRFNSIKAGLLKTKASAGIPNYVPSFLFAEKCILRQEAITTREVANGVVFLLSPASSGMNASSLLVDGGMRINYFDNDIVKKATAL